MNVVVIGHGPSMMGQKKGQIIDSYDVVVRLKNSGPMVEKTPEDYGTRTDHLCMSTEVLGLSKIMQAGSYWLYPKNGDYDRLTTFKEIADQGAPFMIPRLLLNKWNERFRETGARHSCVSTGMAAIIIAAHYYEPEMIVLGGFDTLLDPTKPFLRNNDAPRTGVGEITHDWMKENELLKRVSDTYNFMVGVL